MQNSSYSHLVQQPRCGQGMPDSPNIGVPPSTYPPKSPSTPPLVFTAQCGGVPAQLQDPLSSSLYTEPLQMSYPTLLGRHNSCTLIEVEDSPIKVTCRTRGGSRSPYMAPMPSEMAADTDRSGRHNPYSFSFSGSSSPRQLSTPTHSPQINTFEMGGDPFRRMLCGGPCHGTRPSAADAPLMQGHSVRLDTMFALPSEVVHRSLKDRCRYIQFPADLPPISNSGTAGPHANNGNHTSSNGSTGSGFSGENNLPMALFIGQVRFETTPAELLWLVHRTCGACASHLESRGAGCYLLYCKSEADLTLVRSLHKRILFDIGGVWLARTADEVDAMCEYIALDAPLLSKKARLPRDSMVVEELKADAVNSGGRRAHGGGGGHERRTFSDNNLSGHCRGGGRGSSAQGSGVDDIFQAAGGEVSQNIRRQQQQQREREGLPSYEESALSYPGHPPQFLDGCPLYK
ncbi:hypothetical protein MNV84_04926 [Leishmania braziliensis]|nr:hypothetical protein MNV84_04926 [Leishmania braziliensis]